MQTQLSIKYEACDLDVRECTSCGELKQKLIKNRELYPGQLRIIPQANCFTRVCKNLKCGLYVNVNKVKNWLIVQG